MLSFKARARLSAALLAAAVVALPLAVFGGQVGNLITFSAGEAIRADDFNSNFAALQVAVNDTDSKLQTLTTRVNLLPTSNMGPMGPQGPAGTAGLPGPTLLFGGGGSATPPPGGNTNSWTTGATLITGQGGGGSVAKVAARPFTATLRVMTADAALGGDTPGPALVPGNLVVDLVWKYRAPGLPTVTFTQSAVMTLVIGTGNVDVSAVFNGNVPNAPKTPGGFPTTSVSSPDVVVNSATTAQGQGLVGLDVQITPP